MKFKYVCLLFLLCLLFFIGCRTVQTASDYYTACRNDKECFAQMTKNANISKAVVDQVVAKNAEGNKIAYYIGSVVGALVSLGTGLFYGRKLVKGR